MGIKDQNKLSEWITQFLERIQQMMTQELLDSWVLNGEISVATNLQRIDSFDQLFSNFISQSEFETIINSTGTLNKLFMAFPPFGEIFQLDIKT